METFYSDKTGMESNLRTGKGDILLFQQRLTVACAVLQARSRLMLLLAPLVGGSPGGWSGSSTSSSSPLPL